MEALVGLPIEYESTYRLSAGELMCKRGCCSFRAANRWLGGSEVGERAHL